MITRYVKMLIAATVLNLAMASIASGALVGALGDRDFADNSQPGGVAGFQSANAGDPTGFNDFRGADFSSFASFSFTHTFAPVLGATSAFLSLGIFDHDSTTAGASGLSISFDGVVQDASIWAGISQLPAFQYIRDMAVDTALLADGALDVQITSTAVAGQSFNGLGIDFSELNIVSDVNVPLPATLGLFGIGLAGIGYNRRKHTQAA